MKKILFTLLLTLFFIPRVNAAIIPNDFAYYWYSNSNHDYIGYDYVVGNEKVTIPQNSRISAWFVDFSAENFSFIPGQTYTGYLYFTFNNVNYSWVVGEDIEMSVNCFDSPDHVENCTNYITSYTSAYVSGSNDVVIEFDFIAPDLVDYEDIVYISLNNSVSNDYALGYSSNGKTIQVNFNKFSYFLSGGSVSPGEDIIIDQNEVIIDQNDKTNQKLDDLNESINSSDIKDSEDIAGSFFDDFKVSDNGGISAVVTAPLSAIEKMVSGTCTPIEGTYKGKEFSFPCGDTFWAEMPDVKQFLNIVLGGFLCYGILAKLYLLIDRLKDPEDDRVDVMKL